MVFGQIAAADRLRRSQHPADSLALLKNKGLIAVNQAKLSKQASLVAVYTNASQQEQPQPKLRGRRRSRRSSRTRSIRSTQTRPR